MDILKGIAALLNTKANIGISNITMNLHYINSANMIGTMQRGGLGTFKAHLFCNCWHNRHLISSDCSWTAKHALTSKFCRCWHNVWRICIRHCGHKQCNLPVSTTRKAGTSLSTLAQAATTCIGSITTCVCITLPTLHIGPMQVEGVHSCPPKTGVQLSNEG